MITIRSSRAEVLCKKGVLRNFAKFPGKYLYQSLFFNKVAGFRAETLFKKRLWHKCFSVYFAKSLRTPFLTEQLRLWLFRKTNFKTMVPWSSLITIFDFPVFLRILAHLYPIGNEWVKGILFLQNTEWHGLIYSLYYNKN